MRTPDQITQLHRQDINDSFLSLVYLLQPSAAGCTGNVYCKADERKHRHPVNFSARVRRKGSKKRLVATTILRGLQNKFIRGFRQWLTTFFQQGQSFLIPLICFTSYIFAGRSTPAAATTLYSAWSSRVRSLCSNMCLFTEGKVWATALCRRGLRRCVRQASVQPRSPSCPRLIWYAPLCNQSGK